MEEIIPKVVAHLLRMRGFEDSRIRGKYWKILIDGTQLYNKTEPLVIKDSTPRNVMDMSWNTNIAKITMG